MCHPCGPFTPPAQSHTPHSLLDWNRKNDGSKKGPKMRKHGIAVFGEDCQDCTRTGHLHKVKRSSRHAPSGSAKPAGLCCGPTRYSHCHTGSGGGKGRTPSPLRKHGRGPRSQAKTAVQRPPRARTRPCMRVTHVTARPGITLLAMAENHIRTSSMGFQCVVQCCYEQTAPSRT